MAVTDFSGLVDLASERLGGTVIAANDDFFAPKENLVLSRRPVFRDGEYTTRGKWMDGWETRRRRTPGHDWCIVRLGLPGLVEGVLVDTSFFRGNHPEACSIEGCEADRDDGREALSSAAWTELVPMSALEGDSENSFVAAPPRRSTHIRLNIHPDGGVARLRVYGEAAPDWNRRSRDAEIDLAALDNGGLVVDASDMFFGSRQNLILPGAPIGMHDGWETRRRRGPGHDWAMIRLAGLGSIRRLEVDTSYFKGNYPDRCSLEAGDGTETGWKEVLGQHRLEADTRHVFPIQAVATHIRFHIYPDGGVARVRLPGQLAPHLETLLVASGSGEWTRRMAELRPFRNTPEVLDAAERVWRGLAKADWLEAFHSHPRIGEQSDGRPSLEQAGALAADAAVLQALQEDNRAYEARFGHIFLVCAAGKSGVDLLAGLRSRLGNDPETEWLVAAEEQRKITRLRLETSLS